jgi:L-fuculose-phosphate aldolase
LINLALQADLTGIIAVMQDMYARRMVTGVAGNASWREAEGRFWITPSGRDYLNMQPDDLVQVDLSGQTRRGIFPPSRETPLHAALYRVHPEARAIVHVHSVYASMFAAAGREIPVILEETAQIIGHPVPVTNYAPCGSGELAEEAAGLSVGKQAVLLAHHGLIAWADDLAEAAKICSIAERTAQIAVGAAALNGGNLTALSPEQVSFLRTDYLRQRQPAARP